MSSNGYGFEVVIVDDKSADDTYNQALNTTKNPMIRVYR